MALVIPFHPETASAVITIEGVRYRVPLVDASGHLQVDVLNLAGLLTALQSVGTDELRARIIANVLATDAATAANQATMITALQLIDDLRAALDAVQTDRLNVNVYRDGASEVKLARKRTSSDSTSRATALTPTSGKAIRLVSCIVINTDTTATRFEVYFGNGASIGTVAGKEIMEVRLGVNELPNFGLAWPDGGGPIGAVDDIISVRTVGNISAGGTLSFAYREE